MKIILDLIQFDLDFPRMDWYVVLVSLGIAYERMEAQPMADQIMFFDCELTEDVNLPRCFRIMED